MSEYTREEYDDIFRGDGIGHYVEQGWLDLDRVQEPHLYPVLVEAYDAWDAYQRAIRQAADVGENYLNYDF